MDGIIDEIRNGADSITLERYRHQYGVVVRKTFVELATDPNNFTPIRRVRSAGDLTITDAEERAGLPTNVSSEWPVIASDISTVDDEDDEGWQTPKRDTCISDADDDSQCTRDSGTFLGDEDSQSTTDSNDAGGSPIFCFDAEVDFNAEVRSVAPDRQGTQDVTCRSCRAANPGRADAADARRLQRLKGGTTVMVQNLPSSMSQADFCAEVGKLGYDDLHDFLYMPTCLSTGQTMTYAFVNLLREDLALAFVRDLDKLGMRWCRAHVQGREKNMREVDKKHKRVRNGKFLPIVPIV